ncbi:MAG: carboxypeptidase regulatory-like domain-containing protein [Firmicutes bacterium]|nr:carboxypeptidase regulatory-like domain-containing protein [Bacillota bacterium]
MKKSFLRWESEKVSVIMPAIMLVVMMIFSSVFTGCSSSSDNSGDDAGYLIDGRVTNAAANLYVQGATCELQTYTDGTVLQTTTTDEDGYFYFSRVQAGRYQVTVSKTDYVTVNTVFYLESDYTDDIVLTAKNEWSDVYGSAHPYSASDHYVAVKVIPQDKSKAAGFSSVAVDITENKAGKAAKAYGDQGFLQESGVVDWDATVTYSNGHAFFHDVDGSTTYTIKLSKSHHTFENIADVRTSAGEISTYIVRGEDQGGSDMQVPANSPFTYNIGINYESWTVGRNNRDINKDMQQISTYFKLVRTYHSTAVGTSDPTNPTIEPTQQTVITYVVQNNMEMVMGTNMNEIVQGGYGTPWSAGLMCDSNYTDLWVQMLISSFGSASAVQQHLKAIAIGNELDDNGPPTTDGSFDTYCNTWIPTSYKNLKASMSKYGLGSIPITTTIANYPSDGVSNKVAVATTKLINDNWSSSWNNGSPFVMYNQYTPNNGVSTDFNSVINYFTNLQTQLQGASLNVEVFVGETGYSAENGASNQQTVVNAMFSWLTGQYQNGGTTVPLFVFEAFDLPAATAGQQQFGIFQDDSNNVPTGVKTGINIPSWTTTPR